MSRTNHHAIAIAGIRSYLDEIKVPCVITELHTTSMRRMPVQLKGWPDLIISTCLFTVYCEIKPVYARSRDVLSDDQCRFYLGIWDLVNKHTRYWVVENAIEFQKCWEHDSYFYMQSYHQDRVKELSDG